MPNPMDTDGCLLLNADNAPYLITLTWEDGDPPRPVTFCWISYTDSWTLLDAISFCSARCRELELSWPRQVADLQLHVSQPNVITGPAYFG